MLASLSNQELVLRLLARAIRLGSLFLPPSWKMCSTRPVRGKYLWGIGYVPWWVMGGGAGGSAVRSLPAPRRGQGCSSKGWGTGNGGLISSGNF